MSTTDTVRGLLRTSSTTRLVGVDVARCIALLGMMATHIRREVDFDGTLTLSHEIFGGRASALFAVLAGVSMALVTGGRRPHHGSVLLGDVAGLVARSLLIGALGLWLGGLDTNIAIILTYYALLFLLGLPFLRLPAWALAALAGTWALLGPLLSHAIRRDLPPPDFVVPSGESLTAIGDLVQNLLFTGYYPAFSWLAYLLAGMAVGRLDLRRVRVALSLAVGGGVLALAASGVSRLLLSSGATRARLLESADFATWTDLQAAVARGSYGVTPTDSWRWLAIDGPHSATPFDLLHTTGTALLLLGACLAVARVAPRAWQVAFGAGAMTLTLYSLHIVMLTPDVWPQESPSSYLPQVFVIVVIGAVFAAARVRGPLETVVRAVSRAAAAAVSGALTPAPSRRT